MLLIGASGASHFWLHVLLVDMNNSLLNFKAINPYETFVGALGNE